MSANPHVRLRLPGVQAQTGMSKTEVYRKVRQGRFPKQHRISHKVAYWLQGDVDQWLALGEDAWSLL